MLFNNTVLKTYFLTPCLATFLLASSQAYSASAEHTHDHKEHAGQKHQTESHRDQDQHEDEDTHQEGDTHKGHTNDSHVGHDDDQASAEHEEGEEGVNFTPKQMALAGIEVALLRPQKHDFSVYAPGELQANGYTSYLVSPRIDSVVVKRFVTLGQHVAKGQNLVTLFSQAMALLQADHLSLHAEWQRVKSLGKATVGAKRYINASSQYQANLAQLKAFGMDQASIAALDQGKNKLGEYSLTAAIDGAVLSDNFNQGQSIDAGAELFELADESQLWVEAKLPANSRLTLAKGSVAMIKVAGEAYQAEIAQEAHTIDPVTRTRIVRLLVDNQAHQLHPGMFVDVYFQFKTQQAVYAVPETALMRSSDGDWTVFVEDHPGEFQAVEVELGQSLGSLREIKGLPSQSRVVLKGAFFVASQIAKGGFDPHNH